MLRPSLTVAVAVLASALAACSSSSDSPTTTTDAATDAPMVDAAHPDTNAEPVDAAPPICWFVKSSKSNERACDDCSDTNCNTEHVNCFGATYLDAKFSGVCGALGDCLCGCKESDQICQQACIVSAPDACRTCMNTIDNCEQKSCAVPCTGSAP